MSTQPTPAHLLDLQIADQQARRLTAQDQSQWLDRYIFNPFRDRPLSVMQKQLLGLLSIDAGVILPITRGKRPEMDYDAIKRVPTDPYDNTYIATEFGVSEMKLVEQSPAVLVDRILRTYNPHHDTDPVQDNGICQLDMLLGNEDLEEVREINRFCLPTLYTTGREQLAQLEKAVIEGGGLAAEVAERLRVSTEQGIRWAEWHYSRLVADMEDRKKTGKDRPSPLNEHVCRWLEVPVPTFRNELANVGQPQRVIVETQSAPATGPMGQCQNCGAHVNLLAEGQLPKMCYSCGVSFYPETEAVEAPSPKSKDKRQKNEDV